MTESTGNRFITPGPSGRIGIALRWQEAPWPLDGVCLALDGQGRLPADDWFITTERPRAPDGTIELNPALKRVGISLDAERLPPWVERCVFAASLHGTSGLRGVTEPVLEVIADGVAHLRYPIHPPPADSPYRSLVFLELERTPRAWQVHALSQPRPESLTELGAAFRGGAGTGEPPVAGPITAPAPGAGSTAPGQPAAGARSKGRSILPWLLILLLALGVGGAWLYRNPQVVQALFPPRLDDPPAQPLTADCQLDSDEIYRRYHQLGENYSAIRTLLEDSDRTLSAVRQTVRQAEYRCSQRFIDTTREEIDRLNSLAPENWQQEAVGLGICAGRLNDQLEEQIAREDRTPILQRLVDQADRARSLESDLINITRELAYFRNKVERLVADYQAILQACEY